MRRCQMSDINIGLTLPNTPKCIFRLESAPTPYHGLCFWILLGDSHAPDPLPVSTTNFITQDYRAGLRIDPPLSLAFEVENVYIILQQIYSGNGVPNFIRIALVV